MCFHGKNSSGQAYLCKTLSDCYPLRDWGEYLEHTMVFLLDEDLKLELLSDPGKYIKAFEGLNYDVTRLYNPDAPLPSRAVSMLGISTQ